MAGRALVSRSRHPTRRLTRRCPSLPPRPLLPRQNLPPSAPQLFVTLNPPSPPAADKTIKRLALAHPAFSSASYRAQERVPSIQGTGGVYFAGGGPPGRGREGKALERHPTSSSCARPTLCPPMIPLTSPCHAPI
jgi:hypothetical protein